MPSTHNMSGPAAYTCPHVHVEDIDHPTLAVDDHHHLSAVLRVRIGDELTVTNGKGAWRLGTLGADFEPTGPVHRIDRPVPTLEVGFCLVKGSRPGLVVQKLTELGIDVVSPLTSERTVVKWDDKKAARQVERLRRVAREALMQSKGVWLTAVSPLQSIETFAENHTDAARADFGSDSPLLMASESPPTCVAIGPEGGWTDAERLILPRSVSLGHRVLRAETAALASAVILCTMRENSP